MRAPTSTKVFGFSGFSPDARQRLRFAAAGRSVRSTGGAFHTLLYRNISMVRRALGETLREHRFVVTIAGRGYWFVPGYELGTQRFARSFSQMLRTNIDLTPSVNLATTGGARAVLLSRWAADRLLD